MKWISLFTGSDVVNAMSDMDFEKVNIFLWTFVQIYFTYQFVRPLENSLAIWKKNQKDKKDSAAAKKEEAVAKKKAETDNTKDENDKKDNEEEEVEEESEENKENNEIKEASKEME